MSDQVHRQRFVKSELLVKGKVGTNGTSRIQYIIDRNSQNRRMPRLPAHSQWKVGRTAHSVLSFWKVGYQNDCNVVRLTLNAVCHTPQKCVFVRVVDTCAGCAPGTRHIDLTKAAFGQLGKLDDGRLPVRYRQATEPDTWSVFHHLFGKCISFLRTGL